jgi:hypothetical protein
VRAGRRRLAAAATLVALVAGLAHEASVATAAGQKPSPQELWNAYPLKPGSAQSEPPDPAPTPTPAPTRAASGAASGLTPRGREGELEVATVIVAAAIACGLGFATMSLLLRRRTMSQRPAVATAASPSAAAPARPPRKRQPDPAPAAPARMQDVVLDRGERFARRQAWPKDAAQLWRCEIEWKAGYRNSAFRAMARAPGAGKRSAIGEAPALSWMLMADPEPPTPELANRVGALMAALASAGWEHIGCGERWYSQRFIWRQDVEPRPLAPLTERAERV